MKRNARRRRQDGLGEEEGRDGGEGGEAVQMRDASFESMPKFE